MTEAQTIAWIYQSVAMGSQVSQVDINGIKMMADGINHAIPTDKELQISIKWLIENELIEKHGKKYCLSQSGLDLFNEASTHHQFLMEVWKYLTQKIEVRL